MDKTLHRKKNKLLHNRRTHDKMKMGNMSRDTMQKKKKKKHENIWEIFRFVRKSFGWRKFHRKLLHGYGWISGVLNNENSLARIAVTRTKTKETQERIVTGTLRKTLYAFYPYNTWEKKKLFPLMSFFLACWLMNNTHSHKMETKKRTNHPTNGPAQFPNKADACTFLVVS